MVLVSTMQYVMSWRGVWSGVSHHAWLHKAHGNALAYLSKGGKSVPRHSTANNRFPPSRVTVQ